MSSKQVKSAKKEYKKLCTSPKMHLQSRSTFLSSITAAINSNRPPRWGGLKITFVK